MTCAPGSLPREAGIVLLLSVRVFASVNLYVCVSVCPLKR